MSTRRFWQIVGVATAGGAGYYLYNAGGNARVAEKNFQADATHLGTTARSHLPGAPTEAQKRTEATGAEAGQKLDQAVADARAGVSKVDSKLEAYRREAERNLGEVKKEALGAVETFDRKVTEEAGRAKSGVSGWFGGGK